jgi:hypothetical protein
LDPLLAAMGSNFTQTLAAHVAPSVTPSNRTIDVALVSTPDSKLSVPGPTSPTSSPSCGVATAGEHVVLLQTW